MLFRSRRVAILVADGVDAKALRQLAAKLTASGAVPRVVGSTLGGVDARNGGGRVEVDAGIDASPSVLFDAVVIPDGSEAAGRMSEDGRMLEFLKDQHRHCKPMLVLGSGAELLDKAGIPHRLPTDEHDPGLLLGGDEEGTLADAFLSLLALHRQFDRESDPPRV